MKWNKKYIKKIRNYYYPSNPEGTTRNYENSDYPYIAQYTSGLIDEDRDYIYDLETVKKIMTKEELIQKTRNGCTILATRYVYTSPTNSGFAMKSYYMDNQEDGISYSTFFAVSSNGRIEEYEQNFMCVVPVITLKSNLKIDTSNMDIEHNTKQTQWIIKNRTVKILIRK